MIKYAKVINENTGLCEIGLGTNSQFYSSIGMTPLDVEQSDIDNNWYLAESCPMKTEKQKQEEERKRLDSLSLTRADVERAIYKAKGIDFEDILELISKAQSCHSELVSESCPSELEVKSDKTLKQVQGDGGVQSDNVAQGDGLDIDLKALKIELKANNFYRGNQYINQIGALLGFTPQMLDEFFETNDYRALIVQDEEANA